MVSASSFANSRLSTLLEKCWRISLYVTDEANGKLYVTHILARSREVDENLVT